MRGDQLLDEPGVDDVVGEGLPPTITVGVNGRGTSSMTEIR